MNPRFLPRTALPRKRCSTVCCTSTRSKRYRGHRYDRMVQIYFNNFTRRRGMSRDCLIPGNNIRSILVLFKVAHRHVMAEYSWDVRNHDEYNTAFHLGAIVWIWCELGWRQTSFISSALMQPFYFTTRSTDANVFVIVCLLRSRPM